jgi:hypothetical protein
MNFPTSSLLYPKVICVRSFVPKEKNSACSAICQVDETKTKKKKKQRSQISDQRRNAQINKLVRKVLGDSELGGFPYLISHQSCPGDLNHCSNFVPDSLAHIGEHFLSNLADKSHLMPQFLEIPNVSY